jgi:hypothetical protein
MDGDSNNFGTGSDDLSKVMSNMVAPIYLDVGYRLIPQLMVGAYFMYAVGSTGDFENNCGQNGTGCSLQDTRFGAQVNVHPIPASHIDPWFGAGIGYEWAALNVTTTNGSAGYGYSGMEYFSLQGGADFKLHAVPDLGIGPFLTFSVGQFSNANADVKIPGVTSPGGISIPNQALHEWFIFGIRGVYDIRFQ